MKNKLKVFICSVLATAVISACTNSASNSSNSVGSSGSSGGQYVQNFNHNGAGTPKLPAVAANVGRNDQKISNQLKKVGNLAKEYQDAEDKEAFVKGRIASSVNSKVGSYVVNSLKPYDINAEIDLNLDNDFEELKPSGKILVPFTSNDSKKTTFIQSGLTNSYNDRVIGHVGAGLRYYPDALSYDEVGGVMYGANIFYDRDIKRQHQRASFGLEYMNKDFKVSSNLYQPLSNWKGSPDFEAGFAEEKPAAGYDVNLQLNLLRNTALKLGFARWLGDNVSLFGDTDDLEKDPSILSAGIEYHPVPAISLQLNHEQATTGQKNSSVMLGFNVPLGDAAFKQAFDPDSSSIPGMSLQNSRNMFVSRDYTMPLKYRSKNGMYHISYCGQPGENKYCFLVNNGLNQPAENIQVNIKPDDKCVILDNNGSYITNADGRITSTVTESCTPQTGVTVSAGKVQEHFNIIIQKLSFILKAIPNTIERWQTSILNLKYKSSSDAENNFAVQWAIKDNKGTLSDADDVLNKEANATFIPDTSINHDYVATVTATVQGSTFESQINVKVYGAADGDFKVDKDMIEGTETTAVSWSNLKPNSKVTIETTGDGKVSANEDGSGASNKVEVVADENGKAVVYIKADNVDDGNIHVKASSDDPYVNPEQNIKVHSYVPTITLPDDVNPTKEFEIKISNLKPQTEVTFTDGDYAAIDGSHTFTVDASGTVTVKYVAGRDFTVGKINGISMTYYRNVANDKVREDLDQINMNTYVLELKTDKTEIWDDEQYVATISGGLPGEAVEWSIEETQPAASAEIVESQDIFDENGEAKAVVKGIDPFENPSTILAHAQDIDLKATVQQKYHVFDCTVKSSGTAGGSNMYPSGNASYDSLPQFKNQANTIDYKTNYQFVLQGFKPESDVTVTLTNTPLSTGEYSKVFKADENGEIAFEFNEVDDFSIKNVQMQVNYLERMKSNTYTSKDFNLSLYDYNLTISASKEEIVPEDSTEITISGGKPNEPVSFTLTDNGKFISKDAVFDENGEATAVVRGTDKTGSDIVINYSTSGKSGSKTIALLELPEFKEFSAGGYQSYGCNANTYNSFQPVQYTYTVEGWNYVTSVTLETESTRVDDAYGLYVQSGDTEVGKIGNGQCEGDCKYNYCHEVVTKDFKMTSSQLIVKAGPWNGSPKQCYLTGRWKVTLHYDLPEKEE